MAWRLIELATAFVLVVGVLGVSTALIGEVQDAVRDADPPQPQIDFVPPATDEPGLPLQAFTLLDPAPATLDNARFHMGLLSLPHEGTLDLSQGDQLEPDPMPIPTPATARFPDGATTLDGAIACPKGCTVETPRMPLPIPAGATLQTPTPPPQGPFSQDTQLELEPGTRLLLDPIPVHSDTTLPLLETTLIRLPPDTETPLPEENGKAILPAGTHIQGPPGAGLEDLPNLDGIDGPQPPDLPGPPFETAEPTLTIDRAPTTLKKGTNHHVTGTLILDGDPLPDKRITITANATPHKEGYPMNVGTVTTGPEGAFNATIQLPTHAPAQPYHIIAQTPSDADHDPPLAPAQDQAHVPLEATTNISMDAPAREGLNLAFPLRVNLTDEHGAPVPHQPIRHDVEGADWTTHARTDADGHAILIHEGLPDPGDWTLEALFPGTQHLASSSATNEVIIVHERIETPAHVTTPRGENATVSGRILHDAQATTATLTATLRNETTTTRSDADGRFTLNLTIPPTHPTGNHTLTLDTNTTTHTRSLILTVTGQPQLHALPPRALPQGATIQLPIQATLTNDDAPVPHLPLEAHTLQGSHQATTDANGDATLSIPLGQDPLEVALETPRTSTYAPSTADLTLRPESLRVDGTPVATTGTPHETLLHLSAGAPLTHEHVILQGPDIEQHALTDANGTATFELQAPPDLEPGQHDASLHLPNLGMHRSLALTVLNAPHLNVTILNPGTNGDPIQVEARLSTPEGPLPHHPLVARTHGAVSSTATAITGEDGTAHLTLDRPTKADGETNVTISAEESGHTASTTHTETVHVTPSPFPWWTLLLLASLPPVAWAIHRHRTSTTTPQSRTPPNTPHISLDIEQDPQLPPIWHPGDPIPLLITLTAPDGEPIPNAILTLRGPRGAKTIETNDEGTFQLKLPPHPKGTHTYTARYDEGPRPATETLLEFRVVGYREEIDREYEKLRRAALQAGHVEPDATPRELAQELGAGDQARRMARLFERCNYSNRPVNRNHYERFMKAKEACRRDALAPGRG